jgi:hypothetical protein
VANPTKRQVRARVKFWQRQLKLGHWKFKVEFGKMDDGADAACMAQPEYRHAILHFCLEQIPVEELDAFVAHEMLHTLVWPLANAAHAMAGDDRSKVEWVRTEEESLVTALEKLFVGMLEEAA